MISRLSDFYNGKAWRGFRRALIDERRKADGIVYSEYSGKPIANGADIILHHKQPLTLQNVNDVSISLNPENIMLCTIKEHNEIHNRFGIKADRKVYIVYGSPCSGKSTFVKEHKGNSDIVVDIDLLWYALTGGELYSKPKALTKNVFELMRQMKDQIKTRYPLQGWERCWYITGGARKAERERLAEELGGELIFIDTPQDICLERATEKGEAWYSYIKKWFAEFEPEEISPR